MLYVCVEMLLLSTNGMMCNKVIVNVRVFPDGDPMVGDSMDLHYKISTQ